VSNVLQKTCATYVRIPKADARKAREGGGISKYRIKQRS